MHSHRIHEVQASGNKMFPREMRRTPGSLEINKRVPITYIRAHVLQCFNHLEDFQIVQE